MGLSILSKTFADPVSVLQVYLRGQRTETARQLTEKAMVLIWPPKLFGEIVWPDLFFLQIDGYASRKTGCVILVFYGKPDQRCNR